MTAETLTDKIRMCRAGVIDNPYQGKDKKVLFVCSAGILRSATAARLYAGKYNTRCAGTGNYALVELNPKLLLWADEIVFVNKDNYHSALVTYPELESGEFSIKVLDIPDQYEHMHPKLIKAFNEQYEKVDD